MITRSTELLNFGENNPPYSTPRIELLTWGPQFVGQRADNASRSNGQDGKIRRFTFVLIVWQEWVSGHYDFLCYSRAKSQTLPRPVVTKGALRDDEKPCSSAPNVL